MTERYDKEPSLHDWLVLGEVHMALAPEETQNAACIALNSHRRKDEVRRLPLLLRMLSASQPLSSIPSLTKKSCESSVEDCSDPLVGQVASRLENVAAKYSAAEEVDALTSCHAPTITRKISRLRPLKRDKRKIQWNIKDLASVAASPLGPPIRKKRRTLDGVTTMDHPTGEEVDANYGGIMSGDDEMSIEEDKGDRPMWNDMVPGNLKGGEPSDAAPSDSQEAMATKSLTEIAKLVVASLEIVTDNKDDEDGCPSLLLPIAIDALVSEPASEFMTAIGTVGGCDLGAIVSALMHHAPVLRHQHVANALCRAAAPQAVVIIESMGANCPSAVPALLQGCIGAFVVASVDDSKTHGAISSTAKAGVRQLARLSHRESVRARTVLQQANAMVDVQLELAIEHDPIAAACICNSQLSRCVLPTQNEDSTQIDANEQEESSQLPSDSAPQLVGKRMDVYRSARPPSSANNTASLKDLLEENPSLFTKCCMCFINALRGSRRLVGRSVILLRALSFLILFGGHAKPVLAQNLLTPDLIENACKELVALHGEIFKDACNTNEGEAPKSENDDYYRYFLCACLSIHARAAFTLQDGGNLQALVGKCLDCVFDLCSISLRSNVFSSKVASLLKACNGAEVCNMVLQTLTNKSGSYIHDKTLEEGFLKTCTSASSLPKLDSIIVRGVGDAAAMEDPSALLLHVRVEGSYSRIDQFVQSILNDPLKSIIVVHSDDVCKLVRQSITAIKTKKGAAIPHVLPLQLQSLSLKIDWRKGEFRLSQPALESEYILRVLYSLYFLVEQPTSPFAIDPRDLPLKEILELAGFLLHSVAVVKSELKRLIERVAPEVLSQIDIAPIDGDTMMASVVECSSAQPIRHTQCNWLSDIIREIRRDMSRDPSGRMAEKAFVRASRELSQSNLIITAMRALVGSPNLPLPFMTYSGVCRDPLVLFKAPLQVWRCDGLRRIALYSLSCLLEANQSIISSTVLTEEVASELLVSRDSLVIKCLIMASVGSGFVKDGLNPFTDSMLIAMVRGMVSRHIGLVAQLTKQGRNDMIVDWLVDFVPESMQDAESFLMLLSERSSLTAAEKLETASVALRIAIAHGRENESMAKSLSCAALSRLVSSFFLVIGPVGVSVNALDDEGGTDVTQTCRNVTFRMLGALQNVRARRTGILNECGMLLQKLANLCKGESLMTGISGPAATTRKKLLKDIYDAVVKAANAIGTGIKL